MTKMKASSTMMHLYVMHLHLCGVCRMWALKLEEAERFWAGKAEAATAAGTAKLEERQVCAGWQPHQQCKRELLHWFDRVGQSSAC